MKNKKGDFIFAIIRIFLALIFLWAFFDKLFGLGFATKPENAWLLGKSPTLGFLKFATHGPFASFYQNIAGNPVVDWLFMLGLLLIGISLLLGIFTNLACYSAALMVLLMWSAALPPKNHPFLDEHIIYLLLFIGLSRLQSGKVLGLGKYWSSLSFIKKHKLLQ